MKNSKQILLTTQIKRFILHCVMKAGSEPELLMGELELCEKFKVSRVTVRRALEELINAGYVIRISKRRGYFSNPEMSKSVPYCVGILSYVGDYSIYDHVTSMILSGFLYNLNALHCEISFITLDPKQKENACYDIENMGLDALLWLIPESIWFDTIEQLLAKQYPLLVIGSPFSVDYRTQSSNCINFDFQSVGINRARYFIENDCKKIIYCGSGNKTFESFKSTLNSAGIKFDDNALIETPENVKHQLPSLLKTGDFDGLVSDGPYRRMHAIAEIVNAHPEAANIDMLLDRIPSLDELNKKYKNLKINTLGATSFHNTGKLAAEHLMNLLTKKYLSFEPVSVDIYKTKKEKEYIGGV